MFYLQIGNCFLENNKLWWQVGAATNGCLRRNRFLFHLRTKALDQEIETRAINLPRVPSGFPPAGLLSEIPITRVRMKSTGLNPGTQSPHGCCSSKEPPWQQLLRRSKRLPCE